MLVEVAVLRVALPAQTQASSNDSSMRKQPLGLVGMKTRKNGSTATNPCRLRLVFMKARALHATPRFRSFHESLPDKASTQIFRHQQDDARVDTDYIRVVPVIQRIECIDESVFIPCRGITASNRL